MVGRWPEVSVCAHEPNRGRVSGGVVLGRAGLVAVPAESRRRVDPHVGVVIRGAAVRRMAGRGVGGSPRGQEAGDHEPRHTEQHADDRDSEFDPRRTARRLARATTFGKTGRTSWLGPDEALWDASAPSATVPVPDGSWVERCPADALSFQHPLR
jgi:hypothetical protein